MMVRSIFRKLILILFVLITLVIVLVAGLLAFLTGTEYRPETDQTMDVEGNAEAVLQAGKPLKIMSWNIGYGALGDNADFFMDGGKMVMSADKERVQQNLEGILNTITTVNPELLLLQETDRNSSRSWHMDEGKMIQDRLTGYESSFGYNHKTPLVPYPLPPIGKVGAGVMTFSDSHIGSASRIQLPIPFKWPVRTVNLKRCVLKTVIPLDGKTDQGVAGTDGKKSLSGKELVLFNLHLEAYDDGEGKAAQTKMLARLLKEERDKGNYVIAGGDFNQIFSTENREAYPAQEDKWQPGVLETDQFGEGWTFLMDERSPSCRSLDQPYKGADQDSFQYYLIDGFIVSDNIRVEDMKTMDLDFVYSDHNPVVMTFTLQ